MAHHRVVVEPGSADSSSDVDKEWIHQSRARISNLVNTKAANYFYLIIYLFEVAEQLKP